MKATSPQQILEGVGIGTWEWHIAGDQLFADDQFSKICNLMEKSTSMAQWKNHIHVEDVAHFNDSLQRKLDGNTPLWDVDVRLPTPEGHIWINVRGQITDRNKDNMPSHMHGTVIDVTNRKTEELAFQMGEKRFTKLANNLTSVMIYQVVIEPDGKRNFTYVSDNILSTNEVTAASVIEDSSVLYSQVHPDYIQQLVDAENAAIRTLSTFTQEVPMRLPSGETKWCQLISTPYQLPNKSVVWDGIELDITKRKMAQEEVKKSMQSQRETAEMFQLVMNTIPQFIFWKDQNSVYLGCNDNFARVAGVGTPENIVGKSDYDLAWKKEEADFFREVDRRVMDNNAAEVNIIEPQLQSDGKASWLDTTKAPLHDAEGNVMGMLGTYEDITEKIRIQELLIQSEKMLSIGGLAAGMAHEINNPLAGIVQNVQVLKNRMCTPSTKNEQVAAKCDTSFDAIEKYTKERKVYDLVNAIEESGIRASEIVQNMLTFARDDLEQKVHCHIPTLLDKSLELASKDFDMGSNFDFRNIQIDKHYGSDLPPILCTPSKLTQVFLNIFRNGATAMGTKSYGDKLPTFQLMATRQDDNLRIAIEDNGPGMSAEIRKKVFEPFFTTKPVGKGTGLGMSVSYFIITQDHGGTLNIETQDGSWTRFIITLPI